MTAAFRFTALTLVAALALAACETAPITGRSRLSPVDDSRLEGQAVALYRQEMAQNTLSRDHQTLALVRRVGERIARAAESPPNGLWTAPNFQWEFNVVDKPGTVNAYCLPGGKIAVFTGILPVTADEEGLAIVMGHEVAHALMRHHGERMADQAAVGVGGAVLGAVVGAIVGRAAGSTLAGAAVGAGVSGAGSLLLLSFGRNQESEADRVGMILAAHAGYDPRAAVGLWERMRARASGRGGPEFLRTHPTESSRIVEIRKHMPEALQYYAGGK